MKLDTPKFTLRTLILECLKFIKPFKGILILSVVLNTLFSIISAFSIALIKPISQILFTGSGSQGVVNSQQLPNAIPIKLNGLTAIQNSFYSWVSELYQIPNDPMQTLIRLGVLIIFVFIFKNIFKYIGSIVSVKFEEGIVKHIRDTVFKHLSGLSLDFFVQNKQGSLISIITNDISTLNATTIGSFNNTLRELIQAILFLFLLLSISVKLTLIAFSTSIISVILIRFTQKYLKKYASRMQSAMADSTTTLQETIFGIKVIKAYNAENNSVQRFQKDTANYVKSAVKLNIITSIIPAFNEVFAIIALSVVLIVGGHEVIIEKTVKPDDLLAFLFSLFAIMSPITSIINSFSGFQKGVAAGERIFGILNLKASVVSGNKPCMGFENTLEVNNLTFGYNDNNVLKNINVKIQKGKKIAFVGGSGSGKSTLLDLIIRFYDAKNGYITIDGVDIKEYDIHSYRSLFGIVTQDNILFNDSIANNLKFGFEADDDKILNASKVANAFKFIDKLPDTFNTNIGDRGITLSGGERQRLAIARALIRDPQILIFDEATSALDTESEKIVQNAINESLKDRTAILVAHRLSTIIDCDTIYVMDRGEIVESGTHSELIANNGYYKILYEIQFSEK